MKKYFITFGGGAQNYYHAVNRLVKQVENLNLFDNINFFTDKDLKNDIYFWKKHSSFIINNKRGYGYWLWKPYIIKKTMEKMTDGDVLLYLDCGCEIDIQKKQQLIDNIEIVKSDYIIGTNTDQPEGKWNKMDLICKLNMLDDKYLNTLQRQAGALLFLTSDKTRELVNEWYKLASDYHNIDDSPSILKNPNYFKEHRHDQSIYSLLTKKYNLYSSHNLLNSINCSRNKSGISKIVPVNIIPEPKIIPNINKPQSKILPNKTIPQPKIPINKRPQPKIVPINKIPQQKIPINKIPQPKIPINKIPQQKIVPINKRLQSKIVFNKIRLQQKIPIKKRLQPRMVFNKSNNRSKIISIKKQLLTIKTFCLLNRQKIAFKK